MSSLTSIILPSSSSSQSAVVVPVVCSFASPSIAAVALQLGVKLANRPSMKALHHLLKVGGA